MQALRIDAFTLTTALGAGQQTHRQALAAARSALAPCRFESVDLDTCVGEVAGLDGVALPAGLEAFDCRNNRLAELALLQDGFAERVQAARARWGEARVGVFMGTSTSGILSSELAYRARDAQSGALPAGHDYRHTHNCFSVADYVRSRFALRGPAHVVSTACSSSSKVFASAARMLQAGLIDAAVVGGVDSLCLTTLYGFASLQLLSRTPCRPYDAERDGISIGEGAAFALLSRLGDADSEAAQDASDRIVFSGWGESSDAHHMSAPHPEGLGARLAMQGALSAAGIEPGEVDYIALHGTATRSNDAAEDLALRTVFGTDVPCSSLKGHTGHTLGAAGAINVAAGALALQMGMAPAGAHTQQIDPQLASRYLLEPLHAPLRRVLCNSFGFGGSNASILIERRAR